MIPPVIGLPGVRTTRTATPRIVFRGTGGGPIFDYLPGGKFIAHAYSRDPGNTGDIDVLRAGLLMGKRTSGSFYAPSIIGVTTNAEAAGATSIEVSAAVATEIVRRVGTTGTFKLTGPAVAGGPVVTETVTYSAIDTSTGVITATAITNAFIAGSFVQPTDGSETPLTLIPDGYGIKVTDLDGSGVDVPFAELPIGGCIDENQVLPVWPSDASLKAWLYARLNDASGGQFTFFGRY